MKSLVAAAVAALAIALVTDYGLFGADARWYMSPRVALGPELVYMIGRGHARYLALAGNITVDLFARRRAATPFFLASYGGEHHSNSYGGGSFVVYSSFLSIGAGVRVPLGERWYLAPEAQVGAVPRYCFAVRVGWRG